MNEVKVIRGEPFGVNPSLTEETAAVAFRLENGDHLHIEVAKAQLETLSRHIAAALDQLQRGTARH